METWTKNTLLSVKELAPALNISVVTLNKKRCQGGGPPYFTIGRSVRYRWGEVQAWLEAQKRTSTAA